MMRMRIFEYEKFRVFEFSDLKVSDIRHNYDRQFRGTKIYYTQLRSNYVHLRGKNPVFSPGMTLRAKNSGIFNFIWSENLKILLVGNVKKNFGQ